MHGTAGSCGDSCPTHRRAVCCTCRVQDAHVGGKPVWHDGGNGGTEWTQPRTDPIGCGDIRRRVQARLGHTYFLPALPRTVAPPRLSHASLCSVEVSIL